MSNTGKEKKTNSVLSDLLEGIGLGGGQPPEPVNGKFEVSLEDLNKKYSATVVSRMQILNLQSLIVRRERDMNEAMKKADAIARVVIEDSLQDGEAFIHPEIGIYGFLFPGMSKSAAELKCSVIAEQISRLLKDSNISLSAIEFEGTAQRRAGRSLAEKLAGRKADASSKEKKPSAKYLREIEQKNQMANLAVQQMANRRSKVADDPGARASTWWSSSAASGQADNALASEITVVFRAVWNVKNRYLTAYLATPAMKSPDDDKLALRIAADADNSAIADCDQFVQEEALKKLHLLVNAGHQVLLILPVHFSTVDRNDYYAIYFQRIRNLDEKARKLIVLELIDTPQDLPELKIKETITRLRQAARSVIVRVPPEGFKADPWGAAGVHAVGYDCAEQGGVERTIMEKMNHFAARTEKAGLRKFVYGLSKRSVAMAAVSAGFDYIEGNIVRPPVEAPDIVQRFDSQDLFAGLLRR